MLSSWIAICTAQVTSPPSRRQIKWLNSDLERISIAEIYSKSSAFRMIPACYKQALYHAVNPSFFLSLSLLSLPSLSLSLSRFFMLTKKINSLYSSCSQSVVFWVFELRSHVELAKRNLLMGKIWFSLRLGSLNLIFHIYFNQFLIILYEKYNILTGKKFGIF